MDIIIVPLVLIGILVKRFVFFKNLMDLDVFFFILRSRNVGSSCV